MRAVWIAATLLWACQYDDPQTDLPFRCDSTHACPDGMLCAAGTCESATRPAGDGVACGSAGTCAAGTKCCVTSTGASCTAPAAPCAGQAATCDGYEDCPAPMRCCRTGQSSACGDPACDGALCLDAADCRQATTCRFDNPTVPWGTCDTPP